MPRRRGTGRSAVNRGRDRPQDSVGKTTRSSGTGTTTSRSSRYQQQQQNKNYENKSRSRSTSSSSTAISNSRPTSANRSNTRESSMDRRNDNDRSEIPTNEPTETIPAVEPVEQRWEESAGMYTHKKFKKMASSVVVTTVDSTPTTHSNSSSMNVNSRIAATAEGAIDLGGGHRISNVSPPITLPGTTLSHHSNNTALPLSNITQRNIVIPSHNFPLKHSALSLIESGAATSRGGIHQQQEALSVNNPGKVHIPPPSPSSLVVSSTTSVVPSSSSVILPTATTTSGGSVGSTGSGPDQDPTTSALLPSKPRKNVCPYCNISCTKPSVLDKHIRTHTNERPYPCHPCAIAFKTQSNLYKHCRSRTHALKVEKGIDSSSTEIVAELGDSFTEELGSTGSTASQILTSDNNRVVQVQNQIQQHPPGSRIFQDHHPHHPGTSRLIQEHPGSSRLIQESQLEPIHQQQHNHHPQGQLVKINSNIISLSHQPGSSTRIIQDHPGSSRIIQEHHNHPGSSSSRIQQAPPPPPGSHHQVIHHAKEQPVHLMALVPHQQSKDLLIQRQTASLDGSPSRPLQLPHDTRLMSPPAHLVQAVQRLHYPNPGHQGAVLIKANSADDLPKDLSSHHIHAASNAAAAANAAARSSIVHLPSAVAAATAAVQPKVSFVPRQASSAIGSSVTILPQSATTAHFRSQPIPTRLPSGSSINLTNSVELSSAVAPRPVAARSGGGGPTSSGGPSASVSAAMAPDFLQQRIDKVISENQAIVETLDPLWPRRYMRQNSKDDHTVTVPSSSGGHGGSSLTMEKAHQQQQPQSGVGGPAPPPNRRLHPSSQVTMSLVTSSPQPQSVKNVQYQSTLSLVPATAVHPHHQPTSVVSSNEVAASAGAPLSIQLTGTKPLTVESQQQPASAPSSSLLLLRQPPISEISAAATVNSNDINTTTDHHHPTQQHHHTDHILNNAKSVRELWLNSHKKPGINMHHHGNPLSSSTIHQSMITNHPTQSSISRPINLVQASSMAHLEPIADIDNTTISSSKNTNNITRPDDGAMIRELLLKSKGATILEPAEPPRQPTSPKQQMPMGQPKAIPHQPMDTTNTSSIVPSSNKNQLVIQVNKNPLDPQQVQLTLPNVSLILTTNASSSLTSTMPTLSVTSIPAPKTRVISAAAAHNLELHHHHQSNREYAIDASSSTTTKKHTGGATILSLPQHTVPHHPSHLHNHTQQQHPPQSLIAQLRETRFPEKSNTRKSSEESLEDHGGPPYKKPKLMFLPPQQVMVTNSPQIMRTMQTSNSSNINTVSSIGGSSAAPPGIVTFSKTTIHPVLHQSQQPLTHTSIAHPQQQQGLLQIATKHGGSQNQSHQVSLATMTSITESASSGNNTSSSTTTNNTTNNFKPNSIIDLKGNIISTMTIPTMTNSMVSTNSSSCSSIPGIPIPNMSGSILTGIKSPPSQLFSLPGKIRECLQSAVTSNQTNNDQQFKPQVISSSNPSDTTNNAGSAPNIPGIPGPSQDQHSTVSKSVVNVMAGNSNSSSSSRNTTSSMISAAASSSTSTMAGNSNSDIKIEVTDHNVNAKDETSAMETEDAKFLRPTSLPLTPGSFKTKKHVMLVSGGDTLISPDTPRPRKSYSLQYQNGTAYTTLGLKCSTNVYYTTIFKQQPTYVVDKQRISMYSNWKIVTKDSHPSGLSPSMSLKAYNSIYYQASHGSFSMAKNSGHYKTAPPDPMIVCHSSRWKALKDSKKGQKPDGSDDMDEATKDSEAGRNAMATSPHSAGNSNTSSGSSTGSGGGGALVVRTVEGGYKSLDDDYTYVRGRGRGRYVCDSCGIRCKKPSMLKKHIRTHSNFRPYTCKYCNFAFKTKGNLTKHMKSKTHHKKCIELGITPVPTTIPDDFNISSRSPGLGEPGPSGLNGQAGPMKAGDLSDSEDDDMEEDEDEDDEQFEDADDEIEIIGEDSRNTNNHYNAGGSGSSGGMAAKGLVPFKLKMSTYPYNSDIVKKEPMTSVTTMASNSLAISPSGMTSTASSTVTTSNISSECASTSSTSSTSSSSSSSVAPIQIATMKESLQPLSSQAPVIGEKYYFSKTPISNDVARAAAATVMAIASSAINASVSKNTTLTAAKTESKPIVLPLIENVANKETTFNHQEAVYLQAKAAAKAAISPGFEMIPTMNNDQHLDRQQQQPTIIKNENDSETITIISTTKIPSTTSPKPAESTLSVVSGGRTNANSAFRNVTPTKDMISTTISDPTTTTASSSSMNNVIHPNADQVSSGNNLEIIGNPTISPPPVDLDIKQQPRKSATDEIVEVLPQHHSPNSIVSPPNKTMEEVIKAENDQNASKSSSMSNSSTKSCSSSSSGSSTNSNSNGKYVCSTCKASFPTPTVLSCHQKIHLFERNFRCDACSVSFRTSGHLQKHKRSSGHFNKVSINATFGEPSPSNPRPFNCGDCRIGFRIHGHLAKHLRSKSHIMKLENSGKLPIGMYAEMERLGTNFNEIDTSSCESSLSSLKSLASKFCKSDLKLAGDLKHSNGYLTQPPTNSNPGNLTDIKEEPMEIGLDHNNSIRHKINEQSQTPPATAQTESVYRKSPDQNHVQNHHHPTSVSAAAIFRKSPDHHQHPTVGSPVQQQQAAPPNRSHQPHIPIPNGIPNHVALNLTKPQLKTSNTVVLPVSMDRRASFSSSGQDDPSTDSEAESNCKPKSERFPCKQCPQIFRDMKSLQIHQFVEHHHESTIVQHQNNRQFGSNLATPSITSVAPGTTSVVAVNTNSAPTAGAVVRLPILQSNPTSTIQHHPGIVYRQIPRHESTAIIPNAGIIPKSVHPGPPPSLNLSNGGAPSSREGSISSDSGEGRAASPILNLKCDLCGLTNITSSKALQQHIFSAHAPARPFVCPRCDAGFTAQHQLEAHMKVH